MADLDVGIDLGAVSTKLAVLDRHKNPVAPLRATVASTDESPQAFLSTLLRAPADDRDGRFGLPRRAVVAVPHSWFGDERSLLEESLFGTGDGRLVSQPIAAGAYLCWRDPSLKGVPLVLCDLGATTIRMSVCRASAGRVDLLTHEEVSSGDVDAALADHAIRHGSGETVDVRLLRQTIAYARTQLDPEVEAELWAGRRTLFGREPYVTAGPYQLTFDDAVAATEAITTAATELANRVRPSLTGAWRLALLGGGALFHPLRQAIQHGLGTGDVVDLDRDTVLRAAAHGAALVAGGEVDPGDRYPHAVSLVARRVSGGALTRVEVLLAKPGELRAGGRSLPSREPVRFADDGRDVELLVRDRAGVGYPVRLVPPPTLRGGTFTVALRQRPTGECVLVCRSGEAVWREWDLGVLPASGEGG